MQDACCLRIIRFCEFVTRTPFADGVTSPGACLPAILRGKTSPVVCAAMGVLDGPTDTSSPSWTFSGVHGDEPVASWDHAGPGEYQSVDMPWGGVAHSFGSGTGDRGPPLIGSDTPGPGTYQERTSPTLGTAAAYSFGGSVADRSLSANNSNPGPGAYSYAAGRSGPAYSLSGRHDTADVMSTTPAAGCFGDSHLHTAAAYSMGGASADRSLAVPNDTPGPGSYNYRIDATKQSAPSHSIGGQSRTPTVSRSGGPDPGSYNYRIDATKTSAPSYSMGGNSPRLSKPVVQETPGLKPH